MQILGHEINIPFPPTNEQLAVCKEVKEGTRNILIDAKAGAGKTSTLKLIVNLILAINPNARILLLAFNKSIVKELQIVMPKGVDIYTSHSLGFQLQRRQATSEGRKIKLENNKAYQTVSELLKNVTFDEGIDPKGFASNVMKLVDLGMINLIQESKELVAVAEHHSIELLGTECDYAYQAIQIMQKDKNNISFTEMIANCYYDKNIKFPNFDFVLGDECQDFNKAQQHIALQCAKPDGRTIFVGDPHQCQPKGTMVHMSDNTIKPIEDVKIGDRLIGYSSRSKCSVTGRYSTERKYQTYGHNAPTVLDKKSHVHIGKMIEIRTLDKVSKYTSDHICYAKFVETEEPKYSLYLMQKGENFRIGIYKILGDSKGNFGINAKSRVEKADKTWILDIFETREQAYLYEQLMSYKCGIPQTIFTYNNQKKSKLDQSQIDEFWELYHCNIAGVSSCLEFFNKDIKYPFWEKGGNNYNGTKSFKEHRACNLFAKYMAVGLLNKTNKLTSQAIESVIVTEEETLVYSLDVSKTKNYFADGILTHNCIYGFAGADTESFNVLKSLPNTVKLPLNKCFRCSKEIIEYARKETGSSIVAFEKNIQGVKPDYKSCRDIKQGDFVMCRNTMPLVKLSYHFLNKGIKSFLNGIDISKIILKLIYKSNCKTFKQFEKYTKDELRKKKLQVAKSNNVSMEEAEETSTYRNFKEKFDIIKVIQSQKGITNMLDVESEIKRIFSDKNKEGIQLSTIHRAKGLEFDTCWILAPELIPSKWAKKDWEKKQENNLLYVAITRAKKELWFVSDFDPNEGYVGNDYEEEDQNEKYQDWIQRNKLSKETISKKLEEAIKKLL